MSVNAVYSNSFAIMSTCHSEILTMPFWFWLHYLLFSPRKWTSHQVSTTTLHSWIKLAALRANSRIRMRKLSNFNKRNLKHLNGFLCIHFGRVLLKTWRKGFLNERECRLVESRRNVHISQVKVS